MVNYVVRSAVLFVTGALIAASQTPQPAVFFTDLSSGPNSGGDSQSGYTGAYVTLYGNYFGASQGSSSVTLNGSACARVVSWGTSWMWYQKIVVQLGPGCSSGNFTVTTSAGASNPVAFTVRPGNIYCISTSGNDGNNGKFPSGCWATLSNAMGNMQAGDTVYLENGVANTSVQAYSAVVNITGNPGGTPGNPIAIVAYPGATATIGDINNSPYAIRVPQIGDSPAYYVIAGLTIRGQEAIDAYAADHWWIVGNDMSCTTGGIGCFHGNGATNLFLYGNNVHDIVGAVKLYHAIYFTTNTNHVWAGWNTVDPDPKHTGAAGCRGIQFYSTGGSDQYDLHVHDNVIRNTICDGLNFATVNPDSGTVEAYNNVIYHSGTGPDPQGQLSDYSCVLLNSSGSPKTLATLSNNTLFDCGARGWSGISGAFNIGIPARLVNNVSYMSSNVEAYVNGSCSNLSGSNNNWYGNGPAPCSSNLTGNLSVDPGLVSTVSSSIDLHLKSGSPMINAGAAVGGLSQDMTGILRPQGSANDIGAYEYFSGSGPVATCDLNGDGTVNDTDVTIAKDEALGTSSQSSVDLNGDGIWDVVDVQRVINARNGQACRIGP